MDARSVEISMATLNLNCFNGEEFFDYLDSDRGILVVLLNFETGVEE